MKRIISMMLAIALVFSLSACSKNNTSSDIDSSAPTQVETFSAPENYAFVLLITINPQFKLYLDENNNVLAVEPVNDDAKTFSDEIDFENKSFESVIGTLVEKANENGFIKENATVNFEITEQKAETVSKDDILQKAVAAAEQKATELKITITAEAKETEDNASSEESSTTSGNTSKPNNKKPSSATSTVTQSTDNSKSNNNNTETPSKKETTTETNKSDNKQENSETKIYTKSHYDLMRSTSGSGMVIENYGLTNTADIPAHIIVDEAVSNYFSENEWENDITIDEATLKTYALKTFANISNTQWNRVKNTTFSHLYLSCKYENGNFIISVGGGSGDTTYSETVRKATSSANILQVYYTVYKKVEVDNPYNLFNESDYESYDKYEKAVEKYMNDNGIGFNGMDSYYYQDHEFMNYIITYERESFADIKVYADKMVCNNSDISKTLKIKSFELTDSFTTNGNLPTYQ